MSTMITRPNKLRIDFFEFSSRLITLLSFVLAIGSAFLAPVVALSWRQTPFPGFLLEANFIVSNRSGEGWSGVESGLDPSYLITRVAGEDIPSLVAFHEALEGSDPGTKVQVFAMRADGTVRLFPNILLDRMGDVDFFRLFWLPYFVGLSYLALGLWIYFATGKRKPGRALAFFCASVSLGMLLLFDVLTTHQATSLWLIAIAMLGGSLASLGLRFPIEWKIIGKRPWILGLPYLISIGLAGLSLAALSQDRNPWVFLQARSLSYFYAALASLFFFLITFYQARSSSSVITRRQARLVLTGSVLAFTPFIIWFLSPLFGLSIAFNSVLLLPVLIIFPIFVGMAILRSRLLEVDRLVHRTLVYATLTAVLAGVFAATIGLTQRLFIAITGDRSDAAVVLTTLIMTAVIAPIRERINGWVDNTMGEKTSVEIKAFERQLASFLEMNDPRLLTQRLLEQAATALGASTGAIVAYNGDTHRVINTFGPWRNHAEVAIPLEYDGDRYGLLLLGPKKKERPYRTHEIDGIVRLSTQVAHSIMVMQTLDRPAELATGLSPTYPAHT